MPTFLRCVKGLDIAAYNLSHHFCTHTSTDLVEILLDLSVYTHLGAAYDQIEFLGQRVFAQFSNWSVTILDERKYTCKPRLRTFLADLTYTFSQDGVPFC